MTSRSRSSAGMRSHHAENSSPPASKSMISALFDACRRECRQRRGCSPSRRTIRPGWAFASDTASTGRPPGASRPVWPTARRDPPTGRPVRRQQWKDVQPWAGRISTDSRLQRKCQNMRSAWREIASGSGGSSIRLMSHSWACWTSISSWSTSISITASSTSATRWTVVLFLGRRTRLFGMAGIPPSQFHHVVHLSVAGSAQPVNTQWLAVVRVVHLDLRH